MPITQLMPHGVPGKRYGFSAGSSFAYVSNAISTADTNIYTFDGGGGGLDFGAEDAGRYIIVGLGARGTGSSTLDSVTIGGVSATIVAPASNTGSGTNIAAHAIANVPTGTTGNVVVTFGGANMLRCGIVWWRATGLSSATPTDTGTSFADPATDTLTVAAGGFLCAIAVNNDAAPSGTWSNATERLAEVAIESTFTYTAADTISTGSISPSYDYRAMASTIQAASFASWA